MTRFLDDRQDVGGHLQAAEQDRHSSRIDRISRLIEEADRLGLDRVTTLQADGTLVSASQRRETAISR